MKILFLCTGNSCRSQMAEGWGRALLDETFEVHSAGLAPGGVDPRAVAAMAECAVDIGGQRSKHLDELSHVEFDCVFTLCGDADERCPTFPSRARKEHVGFDDPPRLAAGAAGDEEALVHYRRVRDEIRRFVETIPQRVQSAAD